MREDARATYHVHYHCAMVHFVAKIQQALLHFINVYASMTEELVAA